MRYIDLKYYKKHGNGSWKYRPYWNAKNDSWFNMWKLNFRGVTPLEERRAERIIFKKVRAKNWDGEKQYPKLYKKFIDSTSVEERVLKKDKWRI